MAAYVDANLLVYAWSAPEHPKRAAARDRLASAARSGTLVTSALAVDEFLWARWRAAGRDVAVADARGVLRAPGISVVAVSREDVAASLDLVERHGLRPRDAIHAAVALGHRCRTILSDDPDLDGIPGLKRVGLP